MESSRILPCAHCGHGARLMPYLGKWYVQCRGKDCHIRTEIYESEEQAVACWNRRSRTEHEYRTLLKDAELLMHEVLPVNYKTEDEMKLLGKRIREVLSE